MSACLCACCVDRQRAEMARAQVLESLAMLRASMHAHGFCGCSECEEDRAKGVEPRCQ
jgi:hypothetical protein